MILYQPPQNRRWKPLRGKALRLLIFNTSAVERQRFERKRFDPIPPPFPYPGKGGGSGGYIPRRALGGSTAGTACQGCGAPPRSGGFALDRLPRLCYGWRGDGGYSTRAVFTGDGGREKLWTPCPELPLTSPYPSFSPPCPAPGAASLSTPPTGP